MKRIVLWVVGLSLMAAPALLEPAGARTPARQTASGLSGSSGSSSGRQVFTRNCARCHGADANGNKGPALTGRSLNQDEIEEMVGAGQPPRMPAFEKRLSSAEITAVAAYVRSLSGRS
jgi:mono/diheme cytochrome c family protein